MNRFSHRGVISSIERLKEIGRSVSIIGLGPFGSAPTAGGLDLSIVNTLMPGRDGNYPEEHLEGQQTTPQPQKVGQLL